jgi:hypothetical protein
MKALIAVSILVVFVILCLGLYTLWKGGDTAASYSNKLMRLRVVAQAVAVLIIMVFLALSQSGSH